MDIYFNKLSVEKERPKAMFKQTGLFIKSLPSLNFIKNFITKSKPSRTKFKKDIFFIKISLDIYQDYYKTFDSPCFKMYKKFLKIAIDFYENLSDFNFEYIISWYSHPSMKNLSKNIFNY
jgi:hypothetical protein